MDCDKTMDGEKIERLRERILQCPICIDEFQDPRILPCHHSVCLNCLLDYIRHSSSSGRLFRCPQCRSDVCVPRGGVKDFPPNFYINCIQDELGARPYLGVCDVCRRDWLVSQYRCVNCDLDICKFCIHDHRLFQHDLHNEANIMKIETGNIGTVLSSQRTCSTHEGEALQMHCATCNMLVCMTCVCEGHKTHNTQPLGRKLCHAQKELQGELDRVGVKIESVNVALEEVSELKNRVLSDRETCMIAVRVQARALTMEIDDQAEALVGRIAGQGCAQEVETYLSKLSSYRDQLRRGATFLEGLEEGDISLELTETYQRYQGRVEECHRSVMNKTLTDHHPTFLPGTLHKTGHFRFFHFGRLKINRRRATFLHGTSQKGLGRRVLGHVWGGTRVACTAWQYVMVAVMAIVILLTVADLSFKLYTSPGTQTQTLIGLSFFLYLSLSAVCAFFKS